MLLTTGRRLTLPSCGRASAGRLSGTFGVLLRSVCPSCNRRESWNMTTYAHLRTSVCVAALALIALQAWAAPIYRWVDENGRTQISDSVPEKYRKSAKRTDTEQFNVSPEARRLAEERTAKEKALADQLASRRANQEAGSPPVAPAASAPKSHSSNGANSSDCATWRRMYRESQACFAPYHNADGSLKPGAHVNCTQVDNPEAKCGVESWYQQ